MVALSGGVSCIVLEVSARDSPAAAAPAVRA